MRRRIRCHVSEKILFATTNCVYKRTGSAAEAPDGTTAIMPASWAPADVARDFLKTRLAVAAQSCDGNGAARDRRRACLWRTTALRGNVSRGYRISRPLPDLARNAFGLCATRCALTMASTNRLCILSRQPQTASTVAMAKSTLDRGARASRPAPPEGDTFVTCSLATVAATVAGAPSLTSSRARPVPHPVAPAAEAAGLPVAAHSTGSPAALTLRTRPFSRARDRSTSLPWGAA